jgi:DNA modification methylase
MKHLYYGDNLDVLRGLPSESVDLVYLDPPFNSARNYNVIFARGEHADSAGAQIQAFEDTWEWTHQTGSSQLRVWWAARRCLGRGRGLPRMGVLTLPTGKTSTCLTLHSPALT